ncbi:MAG: hypothetical protein EHM13_14580, partial [Acidobacteria bacterium]
MNQDKSARYHSLKRRAAVLSVAWSAAFLLAFAATPLSRELTAVASWLAAAAAIPGRFNDAAVVMAYVVMFGVLHELGSLPLSFYRGFLLEHRYGLSNETLGSWLRDQVKSGLLGA